jgi:putative SOS response-associated peptidase YedK
MCGRITLTRPNFESISSELNVDPMNYRGMPIYRPRYNVAPTDGHPVLTLEQGSRHISTMYWGTRAKTGKGLTINWRSESFPPKAPRCAVITDGFYEWGGPKEARQPHWFHRPDHALVMLAGMWKWQELPEDGLTQNFVVLTTAPNAIMKPIHNRMPVVLDPLQLEEWLNPTPAFHNSLRALLKPAPDNWLIADKASPLVNSVKNEGPELLAGVASL